MSALAKILEKVQAEIKRRVTEKPFARLSPPRGKMSISEAISKAPKVPLIAEIKLASPAKGDLRPGANISELAGAMVRGGAIALSVLTETTHFKGDPRFLYELAKIVDVPLLGKDFVVDLYQVEEASKLGADSILLIARILGEKLPGFITSALDHGMEPLVEVTDERELELALAAGAELVGINNRDLDTLKVDLSRTERLAPLVPPGITLISESGIQSAEDVRRMLRAGAHAVLVGTSIMQAEDIEGKVRELVEA